MPYQNILLIDDDDDDQEIFLAAVAKISASINCTAISDAALALQRLMDRLLKPDVIFLDLNMPRMNGQQFLEAIKKIDYLNSIPVIIFSTSSHPETILRTKQSGAAEFITKPGEFDKLVSILTRFI
jgi:CheY-like chemotaxis protein